MRYEYGRIQKLADCLDQARVSADVTATIMAGGESILRGTKSERKAGWLREAMSRMDDLLDDQTRRAVRESCACCLGGKRLEVSKSIGRKPTLEERLAAANEAHFVFGHSVTMLDDGRIRVNFEPDGKERYRCVCLPKATEPVSITYCYCCGGHIKHHLQIALGCKLRCEAENTALASGGRSACKFLFSIEDE